MFRYSKLCVGEKGRGTLNLQNIKIFTATLFALIAFAANSILCRLALGEQAIDAASFTVIRLSSGMLVLMLIVNIIGSGSLTSTKLPISNEKAPLLPAFRQRFSFKNFKAASMLFLYAICFSYAYISLDTGTGALILFGSVQLTMIFGALYSGSKLHIIEWVGLIASFSGFVYLVLPTVSSPSFVGFMLMTLAGVAWGIYTLLGRATTSPLTDTANNFLYTMPFVVVLIGLVWIDPILTSRGIILAALSGAIASGLGYSVWYVALRGLSATLAAVLQLAVPIVAAVGGVVFASETISMRLVIASIVILGGIFTVIVGKYYLSKQVV